MGLADFLDRFMQRRTGDMTARAERAGKAGVAAARAACPVRTGRLRDSIGFTYNQSNMSLVLYADAPYASSVNRRVHFMGAGWATMRQMFAGGTSEIQFPTLPEKYQAKARLLTASHGHTIIGHRQVRKVR